MEAAPLCRQAVVATEFECENTCRENRHESFQLLEEAMADIDAALAACKDATEQLIGAAESAGPAWATPRAPGKWSPSQIVEHVARALEESANVAAGRPSKFPKVPAVLHPVLRSVLFKRVLKNSSFPKGRTNKAMNPASGPSTPADGRARLEAAHGKFAAACRELASRRALVRSPIFGAVNVEDYVRFMELHTRHHRKQIGSRPES
jgi:DinB superfamily